MSLRILMSAAAATALLCGTAVAKPPSTLRIFENGAQMGSGSSQSMSSAGAAPSYSTNQTASPSTTKADPMAGPTAGAATTDNQSAMTDNSAATATGDLLEVARDAGQFTTFARAVEAAGLTGALQGDQQLTVFAPTDAAFAALPSGELDMLLQPANREQLVDILTYHILGAAITSDQLAGRTVRAQTASGEPITIDARSGVMVNDANVTMPDLRADNGVIHGVDKVLMPSDAPASAAGGL